MIYPPTLAEWRYNLMSPEERESMKNFHQTLFMIPIGVATIVATPVVVTAGGVWGGIALGAASTGAGFGVDAAFNGVETATGNLATDAAFSLFFMGVGKVIGPVVKACVKKTVAGIPAPVRKPFEIRFNLKRHDGRHKGKGGFPRDQNWSLSPELIKKDYDEITSGAISPRRGANGMVEFETSSGRVYSASVDAGDTVDTAHIVNLLNGESAGHRFYRFADRNAFKLWGMINDYARECDKSKLPGMWEGLEKQAKDWGVDLDKLIDDWTSLDLLQPFVRPKGPTRFNLAGFGAEAT